MGVRTARELLPAVGVEKAERSGWPAVAIACDVPKPEAEEAEQGRYHCERNPDEHLDVPQSIQPAGTIRQELYSVNPQSGRVVGLRLRQIDSPREAGNRFADMVQTRGFSVFLTKFRKLLILLDESCRQGTEMDD